jgi:hypothetical protein
MRWSVEVTFRDSKQHLGVEEPQGWKTPSVERTSPLGMLLHSIVVLWFVAEGFCHRQPLDCPWYVSKSEPAPICSPHSEDFPSEWRFRRWHSEGGVSENTPRSSKTLSRLPRKLQKS